MTTVSVIVPTYNRPVLLDRALKSIADQTYQDYEAIVINDGGVSVREVTKKHEKVSLIEYSMNKGLPAARNTGIRASKGKYITFLDDDDIMLPEHLQTLVDALDSGAKIAYGDFYLWKNDKEMHHGMSVDYNKQRLHVHNLFPVMCVMLRRELFDDCMFDETLNSHEDWDLWLRMSEKVTDFVHIKKRTTAYSKRDGQDQISKQPHHIEAYREVKRRYDR